VELKKGIEDKGCVKGNKLGLVPCWAILDHEAHHRGNILLILKFRAFELTNDLKYGVWEWNKI
jgi:hypothetical protein